MLSSQSAQSINNLLNEYCKVMRPLAFALDILQSETKCYMGILLPTLVSLKTKLATVKLTLKYCAPVADALLQGVDTRFQGYMDRQDLVLASLTMPQFRLRWLPDEAARQTAKLLLCSNVAQLQCRSEQIIAHRDTDTTRACCCRQCSWAEQFHGGTFL